MAWKNVQYENGKYRTSEGGGGGGSSTFAGLDDVNLSNLQNGQVPKYNSAIQKWENADESGGGGTVTDVQVDGTSVVNQGVAEIPAIPEDFADLSDVQFSNLADHQPLRYNATSQKWVNGADNYPPLIYSDEEREIGVWRDGKPLYQKTLHFNASILVNTSGWAPLDSTINGETLVSLNISALDKSYNESRAVTIRHDIVNIIPRFQISEGAFQYYTNSQNFPFSGNNYDWDITIQYTKTTDTAGSGTWTTQGGYAHHYSTTEHVVGTWVDGKPLYEKTFQFSNYISIPTKSWTTVMDVSNLSISKLVRCDFIDMEGVCWSGALNRISNGNLQSYIFEEWPVKELTLQYTKTTD